MPDTITLPEGTVGYHAEDVIDAYGVVDVDRADEPVSLPAGTYNVWGDDEQYLTIGVPGIDDGILIVSREVVVGYWMTSIAEARLTAKERAAACTMIGRATYSDIAWAAHNAPTLLTTLVERFASAAGPVLHAMIDAWRLGKQAAQS